MGIDYVLCRLLVYRCIATALVASLLLSWVPKADGAEFALTMQNSKDQPLVLDLSEHYRQKEDRGFARLQNIKGNKTFDGIPFRIGGHFWLYGRSEEEFSGKAYPEAIRGVTVGRKFDDLYLIHHACWPDLHEKTIAHVWLNYTDGSKYAFPIRYGVHVLDWFNLPSYETEQIDDPQTTICWRHPPLAYKAPVRIFKSRISNPLPDRVVESIDFVSTRSLSCYSLFAATVTTSSGGAAEGDRHFDGQITIRVIDDSTGEPIEGALVRTSMSVRGEGVVGLPFETSSRGTGIIPYPVRHTRTVSARVNKEGYQRDSRSWSVPTPSEHTFRLKPVGSKAETLRIFENIMKATAQGQ